MVDTAVRSTCLCVACYKWAVDSIPWVTFKVEFEAYQKKRAGLRSMLPAASIADTSKEWAPVFRPLAVDQ